jgi:hypothetical protein
MGRGVVIAELLENVEVRFVHYLVENKTWRDPTHVLCSAQASVPLIVLPAKQNQIHLLVFIILYEIYIYVAYLQPSYGDSQHM